MTVRRSRLIGERVQVPPKELLVRMFCTHQGRLRQELAIAGITDRAAANRYLAEVYRLAFSAEFMQPTLEEGAAFVRWIGGGLDEFLRLRRRNNDGW